MQCCGARKWQDGAEVEGGESPTTECGAMDDLREWAGASEDRRPENGDRVGDLDK